MSQDPALLGPDAAYAAYLADGRLHLQRCEACLRFAFPPRLLCPACDSREMLWHEVSGKARLHAFTHVNRSPEKGGPYNVALVDLAEGPRMMSRVDDCKDLRIDMPLRLKIRDGLPVFLPEVLA